MKTHTELLTELIDAVYALPPSASLIQLIALQMKAAEIKGQMMATNPLQNETTSPQPDADGWVESNGKDPCIKLAAWSLRGKADIVTPDSPEHSKHLTWGECGDLTIIAYKPA